MLQLVQFSVPLAPIELENFTAIGELNTAKHKYARTTTSSFLKAS